MSYFYLQPSLQRYQHLQSEADRLANSLHTKGHVDLLAAVVIETASEKHHWAITGKGEISDLAREIAKGESKTAKYVKDDSMVDVGKLDVWWRASLRQETRSIWKKFFDTPSILNRANTLPIL